MLWAVPTSQCGGQDIDMGALVARYLLEVAVEDIVVAGSGELSLSKVGETFAVEFVFCPND